MFIVSRADSFYALVERDKGFAPLERGVKNNASAINISPLRGEEGCGGEEIRHEN